MLRNPVPLPIYARLNIVFVLTALHHFQIFLVFGDFLGIEVLARHTETFSVHRYFTKIVDFTARSGRLSTRTQKKVRVCMKVFGKFLESTTNRASALGSVYGVYNTVHPESSTKNRDRFRE